VGLEEIVAGLWSNKSPLYDPGLGLYVCFAGKWVSCNILMYTEYKLRVHVLCEFVG